MVTNLISKSPKPLLASVEPPDSSRTAFHTELATRGMEFNVPAKEPFQKALAGVYATWKEKLGTRCWNLLTASTDLRT